MNKFYQESLNSLFEDSYNWIREKIDRYLFFVMEIDDIDLNIISTKGQIQKKKNFENLHKVSLNIIKILTKMIKVPNGQTLDNDKV